jgi:hypothetical protein
MPAPASNEKDGDKFNQWWLKEQKKQFESDTVVPPAYTGKLKVYEPDWLYWTEFCCLLDE